jgi:hypothetical protein
VTQTFKIANTGQTDFPAFDIALQGVPDGYYFIDSAPQSLDTGESRNLDVTFSVPENATAGTSSASIKATSNGITQEKKFGFTVIEKPAAAAASTGFATIFLPQPSMGMIYLILFAAVAFSSAFMLKRRKNRTAYQNYQNYQTGGYKSGSVGPVLMDIKNNMRRGHKQHNHAQHDHAQNQHSFQQSHHGEVSMATENSRANYYRALDADERKRR